MLFNLDKYINKGDINMANWYATSFKTTDKDIIEVIKNGRTTDFYYNENDSTGHCCLAWGLCSFDMDKVEEIAKEHKSTVYIRSSDYLTETVQEWEYKDGVEVLAEVRHEPTVWGEPVDDIDFNISS